MASSKNWSSTVIDCWKPVNYTPYPAPDVRSVFSGWWVAAKTPTSAPLWMRWLSVDDLKQPFLAKANPALPRVLQHAQVQHKNLQEVQPPEMANGTLQLTLKPLEGKLLTAWCDGQAKPVDWVLSMMLDVAAGLSALQCCWPDAWSCDARPNWHQ